VSKLWHLEYPSLETAWKCAHVPKPVAQFVHKPVPNLCTPCVLLVHWSYCLATPCRLELQLAWALLVYYTVTAWVLLVHICITSLGTFCVLNGTAWVLLVHYIGLHVLTLFVHSLPTNFSLGLTQSLVHYLQLCTYALEYKMWWLRKWTATK